MDNFRPGEIASTPRSKYRHVVRYSGYALCGTHLDRHTSVPASVTEAKPPCQRCAKALDKDAIHYEKQVGYRREAVVTQLKRIAEQGAIDVANAEKYAAGQRARYTTFIQENSSSIESQVV